MKFKLPALQNVVRKSNASSKEDIKQYIFINNGYAFTFDQPVFIVNLREYVKTECNIEDEEDIEELDKILAFLEHKAIPSSAWKELTTESDVSLSPDEDEIIIEKVSHKMILDLEINNIGLPYFKPLIKKYINILKAQTTARESVTFNGNILGIMGSVFKKEIRSDAVRLFNCADSAAVKYIVNGKPYIVGIMNINEDVDQLNKSLTVEMDIDQMVYDISENLKIDSFEEAVIEDKEEKEEEFDFGSDFENDLPQL